MMAMPSDHLVSDLPAFRQAAARAVVRARQGGLGTIGIRPTFPAEAYGYLRLAEPPSGAGPVRVERFVEKPARAAAEEYAASGRHLWNAGIFIWKAKALLDAAARHLPETWEALAPLGDLVGTEAFGEGVRQAFRQVRPISVDYGVMEKADDIWTVPAAFGWSDVGGWTAITELIPPDASTGNQVRGAAILEQALGNVVITDAEHPVIVAGLSDCIVVHGPCGTLVCHKSLVDRIKSLVERIEAPK